MRTDNKGTRISKIAIDVAIKVLKIIIDRKVISWKRVLQVSAKGETIRIELALSNFNSKMRRSDCQSSTALKMLVIDQRSTVFFMFLFTISYQENSPRIKCCCFV